MSEKSLYNKSILGSKRNLSEQETELIKKLLKSAGRNNNLVNLQSIEVQDMSDGGMGSLYIVNNQKSPEQRTFGQRIAELQYKDVDEVPIIASLNIDKEGDLYELDVWRVDYNPVIRLLPPEPFKENENS